MFLIPCSNVTETFLQFILNFINGSVKILLKQKCLNNELYCIVLDYEIWRVRTCRWIDTGYDESWMLSAVKRLVRNLFIVYCTRHYACPFIMRSRNREIECVCLLVTNSGFRTNKNYLPSFYIQRNTYVHLLPANIHKRTSY